MTNTPVTSNAPDVSRTATAKDHKGLESAKAELSKAEKELEEYRARVDEARLKVDDAKAVLRGDVSSYDTQPLTYKTPEPDGTRFIPESPEDAVSFLGTNNDSGLFGTADTDDDDDDDPFADDDDDDETVTKS